MIHFVIGPACSGKSYFIRKTFPNAVVVDIFDFQENCYTVEDVAQSYNQTAVALSNAVKENPEAEIVLEHTLLLAKRRPQFIDAVRKVSDKPIDCYVLMPSRERYEENCRIRKCRIYDYDYIFSDFMEIPAENEGFKEIHIVTDADA